MFNNSLYWTNRQDKSLRRSKFGTTEEPSGLYETVLVSRMGVDVREVRLIQKSDLTDRSMWAWCEGGGGREMLIHVIVA